MSIPPSDATAQCASADGLDASVYRNELGGRQVDSRRATSAEMVVDGASAPHDSHLAAGCFEVMYDRIKMTSAVDGDSAVLCWLGRGSVVQAVQILRIADRRRAKLAWPLDGWATIEDITQQRSWMRRLDAATSSSSALGGTIILTFSPAPLGIRYTSNLVTEVQASGQV